MAFLRNLQTFMIRKRGVLLNIWAAERVIGRDD